MEVWCNSCKKEFESTVKVKDLDGEGDLKQHYIECTHCNEEYPSYQTNTKTRNIQKQLEVARLLYNRNPNQKNLKKVNRLRKSCEEEMKKINQ